jgi:hypothetical protein
MARRTSNTSIFKTWLDLSMLAAESQQVIFLRMLKLARGGRRARSEATRMGSEKVAAAAQAMAGAAMGDTPARTIARYRKKVRANRRRLAK